MLTVDLVEASLRKGKLSLASSTPKRDKWIELLANDAGAFLATCVGQPRRYATQGLAALPSYGAPPKLKKGISKLWLDACEFDEVDPAPFALRRSTLFRKAAEARKTGRFDRNAIVSEVASDSSVSPETLLAELYRDLPEQAILTRFHALRDTHTAFEAAQREAVLLRAVSLWVDLECQRPADYRRIFRELKFRGLLFQIAPREKGYRITLDGPFSLFESTTKYGLELALFSRSLSIANRYEVSAMVRWGKERKAAVFGFSGGQTQKAGVPENREEPKDRPLRSDEELDKLRSSLQQLAGDGYRIEESLNLLRTKSGEVIVPDLSITRRSDGKVVSIERLGFWSRDAVWKRVEWANQGELPHPFLWIGNAHLRVSEETIDDKSSASLYLHRGTPNARAVFERITQILGQER